MTRLETIISQVMELSPADQFKIREFLDDRLGHTNTRPEVQSFEDDEEELEFTSEQMAEINKRIAEFEAGTSIIEDEETFFRLLDESLHERHS